MEEFLWDLRYAWRALRRTRAATLLSVVAIAFAIAILTTAFSIVNAAFFRPLPFADADRLVAISGRTFERSAAWSAVPLEVVRLLRARLQAFEAVAAYEVSVAVLLDQRGSTYLMVTKVDSVLLRLLGARAARGRVMTADDIRLHSPVAMISDSLWRSRYDADDGIVGKSITVGGELRTIVGVLAPGFRFDRETNVWLPLDERAESTAPFMGRWVGVAGLLARDISVSQARQQITEFARQLVVDEPARFQGLALIVQDGLVERNTPARMALLAIMMVVTGCVFLIACANVGNLQAVRTIERRASMAVRAALGASRARLVRHSVIESTLIAALGGVVGIVLSMWILHALINSLPAQGLPSWFKVTIDFRVLGFAGLACVVAVFAFGTLPARAAADGTLLDGLRSGGTALVVSTSVLKSGRRSIAVQVALSVCLFVAGAHFVQSYRMIARLDRGYDSERVAIVHAVLGGSQYAEESRRLAFMRRLLDRVRDDPRVEMAALAGPAEDLIDGANSPTHQKVAKTRIRWLYLPERPSIPMDRNLQPGSSKLSVTDTYFRTFGIPIARGRSFDGRDTEGSPPVAIASQRIARSLWGDQDPIGRQIRYGDGGPVFTIIGVARDVREPTTSKMAGAIVEPWPRIYFSIRQVSTTPDLFVRSRVAIGLLQPLIVAAVQAEDSGVPIWDIRLLSDYFGEAKAVTEIVGGLVAFLAIAGSLLAALGVYGIVSGSVTQRKREIGLRMALGATESQVMRQILSEGLRLTFSGVAAGLVLAFVALRFLRSIMWGDAGWSPLLYGGGVAVFSVVALMSSWGPAKRAMRVDPSIAMRAL